MSEPITVETIAKLDPQPGDMVVITMPETDTLNEDALSVVDRLRDLLPQGCRVLVLRHDVTVEVLPDA